MRHPSKAQTHKCMVVKTADGTRTSVTLPDADVTRYISVCYGSRTLFRRHLNAAVVETTVRPGRSRSEAVRVNLDRRMELIAAGPIPYREEFFQCAVVGAGQ